MRKIILLALTIFFTVSAVSAFGTSDLESLLKQNSGKVAVIDLEGQISSSSQGSALSSSSGITPEKVRELNDRAVKQTDVEAIIYEINSGGGTVVASKEILRNINSVEVPTVCRFRDIAASGGYLISLGCDKIVADSASMTGSIGVKASYFEFSDLMDNYGVEYVNITSGERKEVGSPFKNTTEKEKQILKNKTDQIHKEFLDQVENHRNLSSSELERVRTGELLLGEEAKNLGLVDSLGGRMKAVNTAENLTDKNLSIKKVQTSSEFSFLSMMISTPLNRFLGQIEQQSPVKATWR